MSQVRIYQPTKTAMQSGRSRLGLWILEYEPVSAKLADPLMGWIASKDTKGQVKMSFKTLDAAIAFAKKNEFDYVVTMPKIRKIQPKDYSANFSYKRIE